jgi:hypothetical protein
MPVFWDNLTILRAIDDLQTTHGGGRAWSSNGLQLMIDIGGRGVEADPQNCAGFLQELRICCDGGLLTFELQRMAGADPPSLDGDPHYVLQQVSRFALTVTGQDRARDRVVSTPPPDMNEDDGRLLSASTLTLVAQAVDRQLNATQRQRFFPESQLPSPDGEATQSYDLLVGYVDRGSESRRLLRRFLGRLLDDDLTIGCEDGEHDEITRRLAREGWFVRDGILVVGQPVKLVRGGSTDTSPAVEAAVKTPSVPDQARDRVVLLDRQAQLLRTVATGGPRIDDANEELQTPAGRAQHRSGAVAYRTTVSVG